MRDQRIMLSLTIDRPFKYHDGKEPIIDHLTLTLPEGHCVSIIGPSGCGKSTLLKILGGIQQINHAGRASYDGVVYNSGDRTSPMSEILLVFQQSTLLPFFNVEENVSWAAKHSPNFSKGKVEELVNQAVNEVGLTDFRKSFPHELSGGQQQRANLARALAFGPKVLLLDEPFSSLDMASRHGLEELLIHLKVKYGLSIVLTTHDLEECLYCSDSVYVLTNCPTKVSSAIKVCVPRSRNDAELQPYRGLLLETIRNCA